MRRRFFNAADNFVGGCYNKLSNIRNNIKTI